MSSALRFLWWRLTHPQRDRLRREIITQAESSGTMGSDPDLAAAVDYLRKNPLHHFPYPFVDRYSAADEVVLQDPETGLPYVLHGGKRLFWRAGRKPRRIAGEHAALRAEQDEASPHRYLVPGFEVREGDIVADVGCAEANFSLEVVERAKHVYLFEADGRWANALEATFRPWKSKVTLCRSLVGKTTGDGMIALDDYFAGREAPNFYKLDVEGYEADVLNGARQTLARAKDARLAVCTYHRQEDEKNLVALLRELGFDARAAAGYMLLYRDASFAAPYFRRGLVRATRMER